MHTKELWDEVYEYIENTYELLKVKKLYLSADVGSWIRSRKKQIEGITYVLDEFHLKKYLKKITRNFEKRRKRDRNGKKLSIEKLDFGEDTFIERRRCKRKQYRKSCESYFVIENEQPSDGLEKTGMSKMAELRVYYYNEESMLELVRYQKKEKNGSWCRGSYLQLRSDMERKCRRELGNLANIPVYSISYNKVKKIANFKAHIFGL